MADSRAENIITAIVTAVTSLDTTSANVFRGRVYELPETSLPCLCVYLGFDNPRSDGGSSSWVYIDSDLTINIEAVVKDSSAQVDTTLNQIRYEIGQALQADITQGLAYVMNTTEGPAGVTLDGGGDETVGRMRMEWTVLYRRLRYTNPAPQLLSAVLSSDGVSLVLTFDAAIDSGSATLGFSRTIGAVDDGEYTGTTLTLDVPTLLNGASSGTITYDATTGTLSGVDAEVASFGPIAITNNSTRTGVWSLLGSGLSITGITNPALAPLTSTRIALLDEGTDSLRSYDWNGSTWVAHSSSFSLSCTAPHICALNSTDIVVMDRDGDSIRTYRLTGTTWSAVGGAFSFTATNPGLCALGADSIAVVDSSNGQLRTYTFDGSSWSQTGSGLSVSIGASSQGMARMSSTRIAHTDGINDSLQAYDWNGSTWSAYGSPISISGAGQVSICPLSSTDVAFVDDANEVLRVYRLTGTSWAAYATNFSFPTAVGNPAIAACTGRQVAFIDGTGDQLRMYEWG